MTSYSEHLQQHWLSQDGTSIESYNLSENPSIFFALYLVPSGQTNTSNFCGH